MNAKSGVKVRCVYAKRSAVKEAFELVIFSSKMIISIPWSRRKLVLCKMT